MRFTRPSACLALGLLAAGAHPAFAAPTPASQKLQIQVTKIQSRYSDFKQALDLWAKGALQNLSRYRILAFDELKDGAFTAHVYDYNQDRLVRIEGSLPKVISKDFWKSGAKKWSMKVVDPGASRLPPTTEEILAAEKLVRESLGAKAASYDLVPAMPGALPASVIATVNASNLVTNGSFVAPAERVLTVALKPHKDSGAKPEIVGASLSSNQVMRFKYAAPPTSIASQSDAQDAVQALSKQGEPHLEFASNADREDGTCGLAEDTSSVSPSRGTPGSATVTLKKPTGDTLWQFDVIRPTASSGYWGSAIELRNVYYKGVRVLKRAHVPIFNVQYLNNACGPYRDWAFEENHFKAQVKNVLVGDTGSGIAETSEMPQTILQSGSDTGNFYGVAIYTDQNQKTTLMTEMDAGWYRYLSMWVFNADGSIEPKFGFGAIENACVCNRHFHHAYWRLEFDLGGKPSEPNKKASNTFEKMAPGQTTWKASDLQETFIRDGVTRYRVKGPNGVAYEIVPGPRDGSASLPKEPGDTVDRFGKSDIWVMNAKDDQVDDSALRAEDENDWGEAIHISQFLKDNSTDAKNSKLDNQSLVVWYGTHFIHDVVADEAAGATPEPNTGENDHIVGPTLKPMQ